MARFRDIKTLQKFASVHASIHIHFSQDRHLNRHDVFKQNRSADLVEWRQFVAEETELALIGDWFDIRLTAPKRGLQASFRVIQICRNYISPSSLKAFTAPEPVPGISVPFGADAIPPADAKAA